MKRLIILIVVVYALCMGGTIALFSFAPSSDSEVIAFNDLAKTSQIESWDTDTLVTELDALYSSLDASRQTRDKGLLIGMCLLLTVFALGSIAVILIVDRRFLKPFRDMEAFAHHIASGNLDAPLLAQKESSFGAFTESFDLMRTELARAKEAERKANQSKKELIATLSHDIKTPLASIKATSELMAATATEEKQKESVRTIIAKTDQVNALVDNLFVSTMEELHDLEIKPAEVSSTTLSKLILRSDYRKQVVLKEIPDCLVYADEARLMQVFDNIISNSYKYACTAIEVQAGIEADELTLDFADEGPGVAEEEILLLTQKFYRGSNVGEQSGVGLGLYNAALFVEGMGGGLLCFNDKGRFVVRLILKLV